MVVFMYGPECPLCEKEGRDRNCPICGGMWIYPVFSINSESVFAVAKVAVSKGIQFGYIIREDGRKWYFDREILVLKSDKGAQHIVGIIYTREVDEDDCSCGGGVVRYLWFMNEEEDSDGNCTE